MRQRLFILIFCIISMFLCQERLYAYSIKAHQEMTTRLIGDHEQVLNPYFKNLGLLKGIDEMINKKKVREWIEEGSWTEDFNVDILISHFYDPLTNKGYSVGGLAIGQSAYDRANDMPNLGPWVWARKCLYDGLTQTDKTLRERLLGVAFLSLGGAIHLVQDVAVPAHTRNDGHSLWDKEPYETYTNDHCKDEDFKSNYTAVPFPYWNLSISSHAPRQFWDLDTYTGSAPYSGGYIGLSEFTNANFFSKDTIFKDYPHPTKGNTTAKLVEQYAKDGKKDAVYYIQGYTSERLAAYSYLNKWLLPDTWEYNLDRYVYADYASQLIPRAVGYSAGLLDYFFRGTIEITLPDKGVYSFSDASGAGFTNITLKVKNITSNGDEMSDGSIELVVKYRPSATEDYSYKVFPEKSDIRSIPKDSTIELTFDLGQDPLPFTVMDISIQIVYKGKLGSEEGAVAVGFKDISEPTPIDIFNNMDKICLNGSWYTAGSPEAIAQVDKNNDGIAFGIDEWDVYPHDLTNIYIRFYNNSIGVQYASPTEYDYKVTDLKAGNPIKALYILGDDEFHYSFLPKRVGTDSEDYWTHEDILSLYHGTTIKDIIGDPPVYYNMRGYPMWPGAGFIYINPPYPTDSYCSFDLL